MTWNAHRDTLTELNKEQWQALVSLHRVLLNLHCNFFSESQHPSATSEMRNWGSRYNMPERMWCHGIQFFLDFLLKRLPGSLEHTLTFIDLAFPKVLLLYETIPAFQDTWAE